jgi:hypothetical protein
MAKSEFSYQLETPAGTLEVTLGVDARDRVSRLDVALGGGAYAPELAWLSAWAQGRGLEDAYDKVAEAFWAALPTHPWAQAELPREILRQGLYRLRPKVKLGEKVDPVICRCHKLTESSLVSALSWLPERTVEALSTTTRAGTSCGSCKPDLERLIAAQRGPSRRWHGEPPAVWVLKLEESLAHWRTRAPLAWVAGKTVEVASFKDGVVVVRIVEGLTADQEWELAGALNDYWREGFPAALSVFLDFNLR